MYKKSSDRWLEELAETKPIDNLNYRTAIKRIPEYFETNDLTTCMMLSFKLGELRGRECEADKIKWNALACFENMKFYAREHNGELPKTQQELKDWMVIRYERKDN